MRTEGCDDACEHVARACRRQALVCLADDLDIAGRGGNHRGRSFEQNHNIGLDGEIDGGGNAIDARRATSELAELSIVGRHDDRTIERVEEARGDGAETVAVEDDRHLRRKNGKKLTNLGASRFA